MEIHLPQLAYRRLGRLLAPGLVAVMFLAGCKEAPEVQVVTTPKGADIYWNTRPMGKSPCVLVLPRKSPEGFPEVHVIEARLSGFEPVIKYLPGESGLSLSLRKLEITLTPLPEGITDSDLPPPLPYDQSAWDPGNLFPPRVACEVRIVRVFDGRVICQAGGLAGQDELDLLAGILGEALNEIDPRGKLRPLAVGSIRNRRGSKLGRRLAEEMAELLQAELSSGGGSGDVKKVNMRPFIPEVELDLPRIVADRQLREKLGGIPYIVLGGLAESKSP